MPVEKKLPDVPDVRHNESLTMPSTFTVQAVMTAYNSAQSKKATGWKRGEKLPTFTYYKDKGSAIVELRPVKKEPENDWQLEEKDIQALWMLLTGDVSNEQAVTRITSLTGDIALAMLAQYIGAPHEENGWQWITAERILDYRGIAKITKDMPGGTRRTAGHRAEDIAAIDARIRHLQNTWITVAEQTLKGSIFRRQSCFMIVSSVITQQELALEDDSGQRKRPEVIAWRFQPGDWFDSFRDGTNRKMAEMLVQCLQYDPYHELWESRLSKYFTMHLRINAKHSGTSIRRQIGPLMTELSLPVNTSDPKRTRQSFEKAMNRLVADGIISEWSYRDGEPVLKTRGWLPDWLNLYVDITASAGTQEQYRQIAERAQTRTKRARALKAASASKKRGKNAS